MDQYNILLKTAVYKSKRKIMDQFFFKVFFNAEEILVLPGKDKTGIWQAVDD